MSDAARHETAPEATGARARLARVYAEALLALAAKANAADETGGELAAAGEAFAKNPKAVLALSGPALSAGDKLGVLGRAFGGASRLFQQFLGVLNAHGRLDLLPAVAAVYQATRDAQAGRVRVLVRAAVELTAEQRARLGKTLAQKLNKEPVLNVRVEPELLGGLVVQVGDRVYDSSVRTRLESLRNHLLASGSHV